MMSQLLSVLSVISTSQALLSCSRVHCRVQSHRCGADPVSRYCIWRWSHLFVLVALCLAIQGQYFSEMECSLSSDMARMSHFCRQWRLKPSAAKQSAVCSTCIIPALPENCQFIWMACAFGMSATQPILG